MKGHAGHKKTPHWQTNAGFLTGGGGAIRTLGSVATTPDFESGTFDHSATPPDSVSFVEGVFYQAKNVSTLLARASTTCAERKMA